MGHGHPHEHHHHEPTEPTELPPLLDPAVPDGELSPGELSRRDLLRNAGLLGAGAVAAGAAGALAFPGTAEATGVAPATTERHAAGYRWLAGDHHIHTRYSNDAVYRVADHVRHGNAYGLDWMVITDHGGPQHAKIGVERVNPEIVAARAEIPDTLVFQGLEWNIPAAEHGTVFVHPGRDEVAVLKEFENAYDGTVKGAADPTPANEALAVAGIGFLASAVAKRRVPDALFLANHPARKGIDSPHELRNWRDAAPHIAIGFEGAPGHQANGIAAPAGPGSGRGGYEGARTAASFQAYPPESYRTWGGFDWMTATVGGLWDSLLAEGKPWWITANSDSHWVYGDTSDRGPGSDFPTNGYYEDPVYTGTIGTTNGDFWPGFYSRTHVGASQASYAAVMAGLRAGRIWVDHGRLVDGVDVRVRAGGRWVTLGGTLAVPSGTPVQLSVAVDLASGPNWAQFVPRLARVDVIRGAVTGAPADRDVFTTPRTAVATSFEISQRTGTVAFTYHLGRLDQPFYVRLRGTDGNRGAPGFLGASVDPAGPAMDVLGDADPWRDLWFHTNPVWVVPTR